MTTFNENATYIPTDYVWFFPMDWDWTNLAWSDATPTNAIWGSSSFSYIEEQLEWQASTTFPYSSITYTNSYLIKNWIVIKNSSEVTATALNWVSWNNYQWLFLFNRTLTSNEENTLTLYAKRELWPADAEKSQTFPFYTPDSLNNWKVLEISRPANWWVYYDQS